MPFLRIPRNAPSSRLESPERTGDSCASNSKLGLECYTEQMRAHVWVMPKRTVLDPQGQTIQHALSGLGYAAVKDVRQGKFFVLNLDGWNRDEAQKHLEKISKDVLTNPVIEEYRFEIVD
jgi:phosphoribosylformylglycinamidine synthase PurS subunit